MTKEEQIKEMANLMAETMLKNYGLRYKDFAEVIYNAGYRKIDGDDYVSREWHDKQVLCAENEVERLRTKLQQVLLAVDTVKEMNTMVTIDEHKKQAVKEFTEELKTRFNHKYKDRGATDARVLIAQTNFLTCIDELLNEWVEK